jgi:hypothetical protein
MAKKQTRRAISVNGKAYKAAKKEADRRGVTLAGLVELGFAALGIVIEPHPQQTPKLVKANKKRRRKSMAARLPSRERQLLGDEFANANGFA